SQIGLGAVPPIGYNAAMDAREETAELKAFAEKLRHQINEHEALIQQAKRHFPDDNPRRKLQFRTSDLLAMTIFVAIVCGSYAALRAIGGWSITGYTWRMLGIFSPFWLPLVFAAYASGRRKLTAPLLVAFAIGQAASVAICYFLSDL